MTEKYYRIFCETDNQWEYTWSTTIPTVCPVTGGHTITANSQQFLQGEDNLIVKVQEEDPDPGVTKSGGNYATSTIVVDVPAAITAGESTTATKIFPYPISLIDVFFNSTSNMEGDKVEATIGPNTIIGTLTSGIGVGVGITNIIPLSATAMDAIKNGFKVNIWDGTGDGDDCGACTYIDEINDGIKVETGVANAFSSGAYIRIGVPMIQDFTIGAPQTYQLGFNSVGGSAVAENVVGQVKYYNWESSAKKFYLNLEYFY